MELDRASISGMPRSITTLPVSREVAKYLLYRPARSLRRGSSLEDSVGHKTEQYLTFFPPNLTLPLPYRSKGNSNRHFH